jgi:hypothetical protein
MLKGVHLTLLVGPTVPIPVPAVILDALDSVEVTTTAERDTPSGFRLSFNVSPRSPLHTVFLLTAGAMVPILRVILIATINGMPEVLIDGVITRQDITPGENGKSTLTITGTDLTTLMDRFDFSGFLFPGMPPNIQVMTILAKYLVFGMIPAVLPPLFMDVPIPTDRIPTQEGTDLYYIRKLARDVGYIFYLASGPVPGTNTAYWGPEVKIGIPQPALNLDLDAGRNVESINFRFNNDAKSLPIVYLYIKEIKVAIPVPVPDINPLQPPLGLIPPLPSQFNLLHDTASKSFPEALMEGMAENARTSDAVTGSGSLDVLRYGRILKARGLVGVRGAGPAFDGLYYVKSVTHNIRRGEYKQSFELTRNGLVSITPVVPP